MKWYLALSILLFASLLQGQTGPHKTTPVGVLPNPVTSTTFTCPEFKSRTDAKMPSNRERTTLGIGERVILWIEGYTSAFLRKRPFGRATEVEYTVRNVLDLEMNMN